MTSGALTTRAPNDLLFAGGESNNTVISAGSGYTARSYSFGNLTEDRIAEIPGTYTAAGTQNGNAWILQLAAFKAATGGLPPDVAPPQITAVSSSASISGAVITWKTNEQSDSQIEYGTTINYGLSTPVNPNMILDHSLSLTGLNSGTIYHYRVKSRDAAGNLSISGDFTFSTAAALSTPKFIQKKEYSIVAGSSIRVSFANPNTAGNLIVAYVIWDNNGAISLSDTQGNAYMSAVSAAKSPRDNTYAQVFYAANVRGGANTVQVSFSTRVAHYALLYIHEYSGVDRFSPLQSAGANTGTSALMSSGTIRTISPNTLLFAGGVSNHTVTAATSGFSLRSSAYGNMTEDKVATASDYYNPTAIQIGTSWIMQAVAFNPAISSSIVP
jgi:hypothetical protein